MRSQTRVIGPIAIVLLLVAAGLWFVNAERPEPEGVVREKLRVSAAGLAEKAVTALESNEEAEDARTQLAEQRPLEVLESRINASGDVEWDVAMVGGASRKYFAAGRTEEFHTCFRLTSSRDGGASVTRTDLACPDNALVDGALVLLPSETTAG